MSPKRHKKGDQVLDPSTSPRSMLPKLNLAGKADSQDYTIFNLSPTNFIKQSLAAHGKVLRNRNITPSSGYRHGNKAYAEWIEGRYGKIGRPRQADSPGMASGFSDTKRSKDYERTMDNLRKRSIKQSSHNDPSQIYNSDVSVVKKLTL